MLLHKAILSNLSWIESQSKMSKVQSILKLAIALISMIFITAFINGFNIYVKWRCRIQAGFQILSWKGCLTSKSITHNSSIVFLFQSQKCLALNMWPTGCVNYLYSAFFVHPFLFHIAQFCRYQVPAYQIPPSFFSGTLKIKGRSNFSYKNVAVRCFTDILYKNVRSY